MTPIDINPIDLKTVQQILREKVPELEVRVFGSRASWTARETSDLDLVLMTKEPLDISRMAKLKESFSESNLPFRVDIVDWADTSENFRKITEEKYSLIQQERYQETKTRSRWDETKLGDVAELVMGQSPPSSTYNKISDGLPFFQGVKDFNYRHPSPRVFCSRPSRVAQSGDILFSVRAPIGRVNVADRKCAAGRGLAIIKPRIKSDARYLEFLLRHMEPSWDVIEGSGSVFGNATKRDLETLLLPWPHNKQKRDSISHILGTLDDKIELNNRINGTLEAMARALFKSWFVDFDPVRTKMESRWRKGESFPGMPAHLHDLFPNRLVNSELGEIPNGWRIGSLANIATNKKRIVSPTDVPKQTPYIGLEHMPQHSIALGVWENAEKATSSKSIFKKGEFLFGKLRPYFHKVGIAPVNGICSTDIAVIEATETVWSAFVLVFISSDEFVSYTNQNSTGTRMPRTSWNIMSRYTLCLPPKPVVEVFQNTVQSMINYIIANIHCNQTLVSIRNLLLPKLISGKLKVKFVQKNLSISAGEKTA